MKIIKPIDLAASGVSESNAPLDSYSIWEPVGRNFFSDTVSPVIGASQSHVFFADDKVVGAPVYKIDPDTGSYEALSYIVSDNSVFGLFPSPNGQYLAVLHGDSTIRVYNATSGSVVYSSFAYRSERVSWSADSSTLSYLGFSPDLPLSERAVTPVVLSAANWSQAGQFSESQIFAMYREDPSGLNGWGHEFEGYVSNDGACYYTMTTVETYQVSGPPTMAIRKSIIGKLTASGSNSYVVRQRVEGPSSSTGIESPRHLFYNPNKGHILGYLSSNFYAFDGVTFAQDTDTPTLAGVYQRGIYPSLDASEFIVTNTSVQPYLRRYDAANYTLKDSLDSQVGGYTSEIDYSSGYIAFKDPLGGYGLIDKLTADRVTQVNPTVTKGDIYTYGQHNYRALSDNNERPDLGAKASPATWLDLGFINPLRMTDGKVGSFTESSSPLVIEISSDELVDGVAMFGLEADSVRVELLTGQALLFDSGVQSLRDSSMINGWYAHFFARRGVKRDYVFTSLPPYRGATLRITLTSAEAVVRIGELVAGQVRQLGDLLFGSRFGIEDWSRKERNAFGHWEVVERGYSKRGDYQVSIRTNQVSWIQQLLAGLRATPVVYIGSESQQLSIIYGFFVILDLVVEKPVYSQCRIEVEGLTDDSATN